MQIAQTRKVIIDFNKRGTPCFGEDKPMEEMPLWFKLVIYATVGLTALYAVVGMIQSVLQS